MFWLADSELNTVIYDRCKAFLPESLGLNARWRVYRYEPRAVYRPHIDGAWPGSGLDPKTGKYVYDMYGDRKSKMTFLIRLNDDFEGGELVFKNNDILVKPEANMFVFIPAGEDYTHSVNSHQGNDRLTYYGVSFYEQN